MRIRFQPNINEANAHSNIVKQMKEDLDKNYQPIEKFMREGGEYYEKPMIKIMADEEVITPKAFPRPRSLSRGRNQTKSAAC